MSYTFGGGTGDDITATAALSAGGDNSATLVCGWWYPTTLTATRGYWSCGNVFGAEVDGTTSEVRMRTDNTTDGQWVTSGANIATDKWWFLAFLNAAENTTVAGAWRVWVGDADAPPAEVTVTNPTSRSGNYTGSTGFFLGNKGSGTLAFQGDVGWASFLTSNAIGVSSFATISASGVISDAEAANVYNRWVVPFWLGAPCRLFFNTAALSSSFSVVHFDLATPTPLVAAQWSSSTGPSNPLAVTVNGAAFSQNEPPRRVPHNWMHQMPLVG